MSTARKAKRLAYAVAVFVALTSLAGGVAFALSHPSSPGATPVGVETQAAALATNHPSAPPTSSPPATGTGRNDATATPAGLAAVAVPPLHALTPPDATVTLPVSASRHAVRRLRAQTGIRHLAMADRGTIRVHGVALHTLGVPLSTIRGFTPQLTASSNPLWKSVARGELTVAYANRRRLRRDLGDTFVATGRSRDATPLRIGAFATLGLSGAQALLSERAARTFGLAPRRVALIVAPKISLDDLSAAVHRTLGGRAHIDVTRAVPIDQSVSSGYADSRIPASYLDLYRRAAVTCPGLPWTVLAGIGTVETGNGADVHRSSAGAEGPMQFLPSTWTMYGYDADGDGKADINDPVDAVFSAARYLCAAGAGRGGQSLDDAIYSYNHAWWYVREVVVLANQYA